MRPLLLGGAIVGSLLLLAQPAGAQDATGPCTASAVLSNGVTVDPYDPAMTGTVYEIPISGTAEYQGSVAAASTPRPVSGQVSIQGPPGIGAIEITDQWTWSNDDASSTDKSGTGSWDLPTALPRGIEMSVTGEHRENGVVTCEGTVLVKLEGGVFDSPVGYVAVAGSLLSTVGLAAAMVAKP